MTPLKVHSKYTPSIRGVVVASWDNPKGSAEDRNIVVMVNDRAILASSDLWVIDDKKEN